MGDKLLRKRRQLQITQTNLAKEIGTITQMIRKYETGISTIPFDRLYNFANILKCSIDYFINGFEDHYQKQQFQSTGTKTINLSIEVPANFNEQELKGLSLGFVKIKDSGAREKVVELVGKLGKIR